MKQSSIVLLEFFAVLAANFADANPTTKMFVENAGYPFEAYQVQTEDGYLLEVHRIPSSPKNQTCKERQVVFLMHGLLCSSADFVVLGADKALAFYLADNCFDVWLGNARGNTYSRKHVSLDPDSLLGEFWNFAYHETGVKDLPAMIDYIRDKTGSNEMHFVGHSIGVADFFVMASLKEEYQDYIKSAHMLTPLIFAIQLDADYLKFANEVLKLLAPIPNILNSEFNPNGTLTKVAGAVVCDSEPRELCSDILFAVVGFNNITVDPDILDNVLAITPASTSAKSVLQGFQINQSQRFQQYDYGLILNLAKYGSTRPPAYPIEKIKVPMYLYYGEEDNLIHKQDIDRIVANVPNVKQVTSLPTATHMTPLYNSEMKEAIYEKILMVIQ